MPTWFAVINKRSQPSIIVLVCLLALTVSGAGLAAATDEKRVSVSRHIVEGGRANAASSSESTESYGSLVTSGIRLEKGTRSTSGKTGSATASAEAVNYDFWIFDADVILFNDEDGDGFFHGIDLLIDADTIYSAAEVYAVVYLSLDFGPWNEYGATEDFWIFGASSDDEYVLVTELVSGYPTGEYDLLIELFDAVDHSLLATFGPDDSSQLAFLPLEDQNRDAPFVERPVAVSRGGGGAADVLTIALLLLVLVVSAGRKIWRRRHDRLIRIDSPSSWSQFRLYTRPPFGD